MSNQQPKTIKIMQKVREYLLAFCHSFNSDIIDIKIAFRPAHNEPEFPKSMDYDPHDDKATEEYVRLTFTFSEHNQEQQENIPIETQLGLGMLNYFQVKQLILIHLQSLGLHAPHGDIVIHTQYIIPHDTLEMYIRKDRLMSRFQMFFSQIEKVFSQK